MSGLFSFWGKMFPRPIDGRLSYWGGHFPEPKAAAGFVPGVGFAGVATFALDLCEGTRVTWSWKSGVIKGRDATERQRWPLWDLPRSIYSGLAYLIGDEARATRATLARYASSGKQFRIGLTYEAATLLSDSIGTSVYVRDTSKLDWAVLGQRCIVKDKEGDDDGVALPAVIQSVTSNSIVLDIAPGIVGRHGGIIMPSVGVFLSPAQNFQRFPNPDGVEEWQIECVQGSPYGFQQDGASAQVALSGYTGGQFHNAIAVSANAGAAGNGLSLSFVSGSAIPIGFVTSVGPAITFHYKSTVTTVFNALTALTPWFRFLGAISTLSNVLLDIVDVFGPAPLAGGLDQIYGYMGRGASLTMLDGKPVWDLGVQLDGATGNDSLQSMTELLDIGSTIDEVGPAAQSDWGRQLSFVRNDEDDFQKLKLFFATVQGRRKSFWLPTQRNDLTPVSMAPGVLIVNGPSLANGDIFAWYPNLRTRLQVQLAGNVNAYLSITSIVDNGNGTVSISFTTTLPNYNSGGIGATLTADEIFLVSWLEVCRLESDEVPVEFNKDVRSVNVSARVIRQ